MGAQFFDQMKHNTFAIRTYDRDSRKEFQAHYLSVKVYGIAILQLQSRNAEGMDGEWHLGI